MRLLRATGLLLATLLLVLGAAPAGAWPWDEPSNGSNPDRPATWGRTTSPNHELRAGCHRYRYRYSVTAPSDKWSAELFLVNPRGKGVGSAYYLTPHDRAAGRGHWKLCRTSTGPGRYTIKMKVTWDDHGVQREGWVRPTHFRMTRG